MKLFLLWWSFALGGKTKMTTGPDVTQKVRREANQDVQIHDVFGSLEKADKREETRIKSNRNLAALIQVNHTVDTAPNVAKEVVKEADQNIQIHDGFGTLEQDDKRVLEEIKENKNLIALQTKANPEKSTAADVHKEGNQNIQIHDVFGTMEDQDNQDVKRIRENKNLTALQQRRSIIDDDEDPMDKYLKESDPFLHKYNFNDDIHRGDNTVNIEGTVASIPLSSQLQEKSSFLQHRTRSLRGRRTAPGVEKQVAIENMQDVYIHDGFSRLENTDEHAVNDVKGDPNLKA